MEIWIKKKCELKSCGKKLKKIVKGGEGLGNFYLFFYGFLRKNLHLVWKIEAKNWRSKFY